jgi:hypothetical protein
MTASSYIVCDYTTSGFTHLYSMYVLYIHHIHISIQYIYILYNIVIYFECSKNVKDSHPQFLVWFIHIGLS